MFGKRFNLDLLLFVFYIVLSFIGIIYHEPWRDEAQSWLIVRDLDLVGVFNQMKLEGTPGLWHYILFPFAKLGFPYFTQLFLHWLIAVSAIGILIFKSPFDILTKYLLAFSYLFAFEYVVIGRNYALSVLLLFLIASFYKNRYRRPLVFGVLIFLLSNTNVLCLVPSFALGVLFIWDLFDLKIEKKNQIVFSVLLIFSGVFLSFIQLLGPFSNAQNIMVNSSFIPEFSLNSVWILCVSNFSAYIPIHFTFNAAYIPFLFFCFSICWLMYFGRSKKLLFFLSLSLLWLFYIFITKNHKPRHVGFVLILIVFSLWIEGNYSLKEIVRLVFFNRILENKLFKFGMFKALQIALFVSVLYSFSSYYNEVKYEFSGSKEVAEYIIDNNYSNYKIASYPDYRGSAVLPYIHNKKFWYIDRQDYGSFADWTINSGRTSYIDTLNIDELVRRVDEKFKNIDSVLILVDRPLDSVPNLNFKLIFRNKIYIWRNDDESYYLYKKI